MAAVAWAGAGGSGGRLGGYPSGSLIDFGIGHTRCWCVAAAAIQRRLDGICLPAPGGLSRPGGSVDLQPDRQILWTLEIQ